VKPPGLTYHLKQHSSFLQKTKDEELAENQKHPGRPCSFSEVQLHAIADFARRESSEDRLVLYDDIDRFVFGSLGVSAGEDSIKAAIREARTKLVPAKTQERSRREIDPQVLHKHFVDLEMINGAPCSFVFNVDESGQQDWMDKRHLQCYIPSENPNDHLTFSVERSSHRSPVLVGISFVWKTLQTPHCCAANHN